MKIIYICNYLFRDGGIFGILANFQRIIVTKGTWYSTINVEANHLFLWIWTKYSLKFSKRWIVKNELRLCDKPGGESFTNPFHKSKRVWYNVITSFNTSYWALKVIWVCVIEIPGDRRRLLLTFTRKGVTWS